MPVTTRRAAMAAMLGAVMLAPAVATAEPIGSSCADCPNYSGAFAITNNTGVTVRYQVRWGNKSPWKSITLPTGMVETHSYPLGSDRHARVPTPYIRFDRVGGDEAVTLKEYRMEFYAVGYAGYGPKVDRTQPKPYFFRYAPDGRHIDVKAG